MRLPCPGAAAALAMLLLAGSAQAPVVTGRAQSIVAQARAAIGGETRLQAVKALSVKASARQQGEDGGPGLLSTVQIDILLPDKFLLWQGGMFFRRVSGFNWKELIERRQMNGFWTDLRPADADSAAYAWRLAANRRACARYLVAWLLSAPPEYAIQFFEPDEPGATDSKADIVDVKGTDDLALRLYFDRATHRLARLTYREAVPTASALNPPIASPPVQSRLPVFKSLEDPRAKTMEVSLEFADHRADDGIVFPHTIRIESEGLRQQWDVSRIRVNPPLTAKDFDPR